MSLARVSTAKTFLVGPILDSTGVAKTDEVIASFKVTKNGTVGAVDAQDTLTHNHTGHYVYVSDGGDFDTLGEVEFSLNSGTNAMAPIKFQVVPANIYDSLVLGTDLLDASTAQWAGAAITATSIPVATAAGAAGGLFIAGSNAATTLASLTVTTTTTLTGAVSLGSTLGITGTTTLTGGLVGNITGNITGTLSTVTTLTNAVTLANGAHGGAGTTITLQTPIAATVPDTQKVDVNTIKTQAVAVSGAGTVTFPNSTIGTGTGTSTLDAAGVRTAIGMSGADLDTQLAALPTAAEIVTAAEANGSKLDHLWEMTEDDGGVRRLTTNALEQAPSGGLSAQEVRNAMKLAPAAGAPDAGSVDKHLDDASTLDAAGVRTAVGMASADLDTQLDAILAAAASASGTGAWTRTVTVTCAAVAVENVLLRLTNGVNTYTATTNASGVATFNVDAATYTLAATRDGYSYAGSSVVIPAADGNTAIAMTSTAPAAPVDPAKTNAFGTCRDATGAAQAGITVDFVLVTPTSEGIHGYEELSAISGGSGQVTIELLRSASYKFRRSDEEDRPWTSFTTGSAGTYQLPTI